MSEQQRVVIVRDDCPACAAKDEALKDIAEINKAIGKERDELLEIREQRNRELVEKDAEIERKRALICKLSSERDNFLNQREDFRLECERLKEYISQLRIDNSAFNDNQITQAQVIQSQFEEIDRLKAELKVEETAFLEEEQNSAALSRKWLNSEAQLTTLKSAVREMRKRQTVSAHLLGISFEDSIALRQGSECEVDALVAELEAHESKKA